AVSRGAPPTLLYVAEPPHYRVRRGRPAKWVARDAILAASFRGSVRRAAWHASSSPATAGWIRQRYGVESAVIPPGIDPMFMTPGKRLSARPYLLHITTGDSRD